MSEIIKQSMADIWASIGDVVAPDVEKIAEGWLVELVPRQYWNWMQNRTDTNLAYLFQHGIPEWDATVEYIVNKSYVTYADVVYKAILTGTNKIPSTQPTYWKVAFATSTAALEALKALTPAADKLPYYTGATTAATTTITSLARTLLDDTTQAAMLTTIGAQPVDATLTALAGVTTATNKLPYFSGVDTAAVTDLTAFGRSLIDDADATAARSTLVLNNVDNTSDANKPVSVAQQAALDLKAPIASPAFTGSVSVPTIELGSQVGASNAFIDFHSGAVVTDYDSRILATTGTGNGTAGNGTLHIVAGVVDMTTGAAGAQTVRVNTAAADTNSVVAASTAFVVGQASSTAPVMDGTAAVGTSLKYARADHVHPSDTTKAPLASPVLTGTPTVPTAAVGTNTTQVASTAYTVAEIGSRAPTKTGGGASGSWGISVTGSSASCSGLAASATTLTGLTATVTELNYTYGVTSAIQTQLDGKAPLTGAGTSGTWGISVTGSSGSCTGNASSATTLQTGRTISLTGDVTATGVSFNGSSNISLTTSIVDSGWVTATLVNGFTHNATSPLRYRKVGNIVYVKGVVDRTTPPAGNVIVTTLPAGFRPSNGDTHLELWITGSDFTSSLRTIGVTSGGDVTLIFAYQITAVAPSGAGNIAINTSYPV